MSAFNTQTAYFRSYSKRRGHGHLQTFADEIAYFG